MKKKNTQESTSGMDDLKALAKELGEEFEAEFQKTLQKIDGITERIASGQD